MSSHSRNRSLVVYHFFEKDEAYITNFAHFLLFGVSNDSDHLIVVAGDYSIELPQRDNVQYLFTENKNNDFGGYCAAIDLLGAKLLDYDYYYFINSSVRGPFLAPGCKGGWKELFREKLTADVGLVGSTINILPPAAFHSARYQAKFGGCAPYSHVQTMAYAMPRRTMAFLHEQGFYTDVPTLDKFDVIEAYELRLSQLVISNGWNIATLLPEYDGLDYREDHVDINPTSHAGDPSFPFAYFGRTAHPFEVAFVKTNRGVINHSYLERLAYAACCRERPLRAYARDGIIVDYVARLTEMARGKERAHFAPTSVDEIVGWAEKLVQQFPDGRARLEAVLQSNPVS